MIECKKFTSVNKGYLLGYADLYFPKWKLIVKGCGLYQKNESRWISFPFREYEDKEGQRKYCPILKFTEKKFMDAFNIEAKHAIEKWCKENADHS